MDDAAAIKRCQNGEREAFRILVERYQNQAVGHAIAILRNRDDALDAVQEAFIDAFQAIKRFVNTRRFYPWFYVLLRNRCFKIIAQKRTADDVEEINETQIIAPQSSLSREEMLELEAALLSLSNEEREIITLKYLDGLSYDELAEQLEIPRGTVMSRLYHARKKLQAKLIGKFH